MSRKVYVTLSVDLILDVDEGIEIGKVIDELDYNFSDNTNSATVLDSEIVGYVITDSK